LRPVLPRPRRRLSGERRRRARDRRRGRGEAARMVMGLSIWHWLVLAVIATIVANGFIARHKGRSVAGWVVLGLLFNPIAFVVLLCLPSERLDVPPAPPRGP